jgi:hypothetical protein
MMPEDIRKEYLRSMDLGRIPDLSMNQEFTEYSESLKPKRMDEFILQQ